MTYRSIDSERYSIWLGQVLALAAAYTLAGRLALLLAIPPGYASAVWPAAGIALAAVLLYGNRLWPGILLGSFCVNAITAWQHGPSWWSMGTAAAIGVGASFQALAGAGLIRRFVGFPTSLNRESEIAKFLLLGGPVSCVVGATCGAAVLLCGTIPPSRFLFSWFTWWVGDTVGVLIFTPLILTFLALPRSAWTKRRFTVGAPLVVTFAVTVLFFVIARHWDQKRGEQAFRQQAHVVVSAIREKCQVPLESVLCLQNFYHGSENITRDEFHTVVGAMLQRHPGMQALEWVERVPRDSRTDYERHQSAELSSPYHITERDSQSRMTLASVRDEYFPVRYLAPLEGNERALGYDLGSSPVRLAALRLACDTGEAVASGRLVLVQEEHHRSGIIIFAPVYRMGRPAATAEERRRELVGFTLGVFRVEDIIDAAVSDLGINGLRVQLVDVTSEGDPTSLGACSLTERGTRWIDGRAEPGKLEGPTHAATFEFAKRIWKVEVACGPEFADAARPFQVWCVLAGGLMLVSTIGGFLLILTGRTAQIEALVDERTAKLKNANVRLQHLTLQAESASRAKSEFLANMSHEIRTPMTAILGFTDILREDGDAAYGADERKAAIATIQRNGQYLLDLINDILDLSKVEAGKLQVERIVFSPTKLLSDVLDLMSVRAQAKGLTLSVEFDSQLPAQIETDPTRLRQILINLIGNAIKFTEAGAVRIVASMESSDDESGDRSMPLLRIAVIDQGIGMTAAEVGRLFQPFSQADSSTTRKFGGTGLGLTISKRFAEMLGGDIQVRSTPGRGSTFAVTIAARGLHDANALRDGQNTGNGGNSVVVGSDAASPPEPAESLDCRILLAEDGPDNQRLISFVLRKAGAEVTLADNGQIALEMALAAVADSRPFDVILMDMQMPVMDGYQATGRLRDADYRGPIIALTAHAMRSDRQRCLQAGCDDYTTKPIDRRLLVNLVATWARQGHAAAARV